jgi:hypothetical protein
MGAANWRATGFNYDGGLQRSNIPIFATEDTEGTERIFIWLSKYCDLSGHC